MPKIIKIGTTKIKGYEPRKKVSKQQKEKFAEHLRKNPTDSEYMLKARLLKDGFEFEFQPVMFGMIPDYYFPKQKVIVELDGKQFHNPAKDKRRDAFFATQGIRTLRIKSHRVFHQLDWVVEEISAFLKNKKISKRSKSAKQKANKRRHKAWRSFKANGSQTNVSEITEQFLFATDGI